MGDLALAVKYAVKDFFKRQVNHKDFVEHTKAGAQTYSYWSYDELCLLTVLAGVHKHTFGVPGSIVDAIRVGRFRYHDLKDIENSAQAIFAGTNLPPDGQKRVLKVLRQGKRAAPQQFTREEDEVLRKLQAEWSLDDSGGVNRHTAVNF